MSSQLRDAYDGFRDGFSSVGHSIARIINGILLTFVYIIGVGPTSILARLVGKTFLDKRFGPEHPTYWEDHVLKTEAAEKYRRQF